MLSFEEFKKVELRVGKILKAEPVEGSEKLIRLEVDCGDKKGENQPALRQIIAGIGKVYSLEELLGREIIVVTNLEPRNVKGFESQGMLLAVDSEDGPVLLKPDKEVEAGREVR